MCIRDRFTTADDMDDSKCYGMSFEEMLNYDNRGSIVRKKKGSVHRAVKCSKVSKPASHSSSLKLSSTTKHSSKHGSGHVSKCSMQTLSSSMSAVIGESERSQLSWRPVIPHPHGQVSTTTTTTTTTTVTTAAAATSITTFV